MITFGTQSVQPQPRLQVLFGYAKKMPWERWHPSSVKDTFVYQGPPKETTTVESLLGSEQIFEKADEMVERADFSILGEFYNLESPALYPEKSSPQGTPGADAQAKLLDKMIAIRDRKVFRQEPFTLKFILDNSKERSSRTPDDVNLVRNNMVPREYKGRTSQTPIEINRVRPNLSPPAGSHNDRTIRYLQEKRADVAVYPTDVSRINHVKVLFVDDDEALVSGMNAGNHSPTNHDAGVYVHGPDVRNIFNKLYKTDWMTCGRDPNELPDMKPFKPFKGQDDGAIKVLLTRAAHYIKMDGRVQFVPAKDEIFQEIIKQLDETQESFCLELFVLTQPQVIEKIIETHYRLIAAGKKGGRILVDPSLVAIFPNCRPGVLRLLQANVPIQFFDTTWKKGDVDVGEKLHAKWAEFDKNRLLLESANWSNLGLLSNEKDKFPRISKSNHEVGLLVPSERIAKRFDLQFDYDWNKSSRKIDPARYPVKSQQAAASPAQAALFELPVNGAATPSPSKRPAAFAGRESFITG